MINITCLNTRGLASDARAANFLSTLHDRDLGLASPDVLMLQETHLVVPATGADYLNSRLFGSAYTTFHAHATAADSHAGVAIALKISDLVSKPALIAADAGGRWIHVQATLKNIGKISLLCVYAPASAGAEERAAFFDALPWSQLAARAIVGGDWNCTLRATDRRVTDLESGLTTDDPHHKANSADAAALSLRLHSRHLTDAEDTLPHHEFSFAASTATSRSLSRLDRFYISACLAPSLGLHRLLPRVETLSDHRALRIAIKTEHVPSARPRWSMDDGIFRLDWPRMELEFYAQAALNALTADTDLDDWYEQLTTVTREVCRDAGARLKTRRTASVLAARAALQALHTAIGARKATQAELAQLVVAKEKLIEEEEAHFGARTDRRFISLLRTSESSSRNFFRRFKTKPSRAPLARRLSELVHCERRVELRCHGRRHARRDLVQERRSVGR
ncbi:MAG: endonuclease/exonuclease/phosphatase family protein [Ktedonobacterales bacterium]